MTTKEKTMSEVKITKENLMKAYENGCDDVKKVLKDLCPREFNGGWTLISSPPALFVGKVSYGGEGICSIEEVHVPETFDPSNSCQNDLTITAKVSIWAHTHCRFKIEAGRLYIKESQ